jgi:hypothetical protein
MLSHEVSKHKNRNGNLTDIQKILSRISFRILASEININTPWVLGRFADL